MKRIPIESNALVRLAEYLTFRARLRNISADAAQIICDSRYALLIHPGGVDEVPDPARSIMEEARDHMFAGRDAYHSAHDTLRRAADLLGEIIGGDAA